MVNIYRFCSPHLQSPSLVQLAPERTASPHPHPYPQAGSMPDQLAHFIPLLKETSSDLYLSQPILISSRIFSGPIEKEMLSF